MKLNIFLGFGDKISSLSLSEYSKISQSNSKICSASFFIVRIWRVFRRLKTTLRTCNYLSFSIYTLDLID
jgi:hypothetical protein